MGKNHKKRQVDENHLIQAPAKLNELDHLILYAILTTRGCVSTNSEIKEVVEQFWKNHNKKFSRSKMGIPSYTYFYQRISRMILLGYIERRGIRAYRITRDHYPDLVPYIRSYMKLTYGVDCDV